MIGGGRRSPRGLRHVAKLRYAIPAGAAAVAVAAALIVATQRDDAPSTIAPAPTVTVASPDAAADTIAVATVPIAETSPATVTEATPAQSTTQETVETQETVDTVETVETVGAVETTIVASAGPVLSSAAGTADGPPVPDPACAAEATFRSEFGVDEASLTVVNNTGETLQALWLDYDGQRIAYELIAPHASYAQPTWLTHPWIVADLQGTCYRLVVMDSVAQTVTVDPG